MGDDSSIIRAVVTVTVSVVVTSLSLSLLSISPQLKKVVSAINILPFGKVTVRSAVFIPESKAGVVTVPPPAVAPLTIDCAE
jgi:hypothetical protein